MTKKNPDLENAKLGYQRHGKSILFLYGYCAFQKASVHGNDDIVLSHSSPVSLATLSCKTR